MACHTNCTVCALTCRERGTAVGLSRRVIVPLSFGIVASVALAATGFTALGGFNATVTNNAGKVGSGTLLLNEQSGATTCISTGSGTTSSTAISTNDNPTCPIDLFANTNLEPGGTTTPVTVTLSNPGTLPGSMLTLTPGTCSIANNLSPGGIGNTYFGTDTAAGFCGELDVTIEDDTVSGSPVCVFPAGAGACPAPSSSGTFANLTAESLGTLVSHASATYVITIGLDSGATNIDQGLLATVPLTWSLVQ